MSMENHGWVAALIAAHRDRKIYGRTRLQKEIKLLQRIGFPTDYSYTIHFYGPYSESLQSDIGLMEAFGDICETLETSTDGNPYYVLETKSNADLPDMSGFKSSINLLENAPIVVLELAATYDAFRESLDDHDEAIVRLRRKKGNKCDSGNEGRALRLLAALGLKGS